MALKFTKTAGASSRYYAEGKTLNYVVRRDGKNWLLQIMTTEVVSGVRISADRAESDSTHDAKYIAVEVARAYEELGDDYVEFSNGNLTRLLDAISTAYDADNARHGV